MYIVCLDGVNFVQTYMVIKHVPVLLIYSYVNATLTQQASLNWFHMG